MKTERRHELQTNELADWIGTKAKDWQPYAKTILGVAIALVAAIFAMSFLYAQTSRNRAAAWTNFFTAASSRNPAALDEVANANGDSMTGLWATQKAADLRLEQGSQMLHVSRESAAGQFNLALNGYRTVYEAADDMFLKSRAMFGMAQCYESLNDPQEAIKQYEQIEQLWPDSAEADIAKQRRSFLQRPETREFMKWFDNQEPVVGLPPSTGGSNIPSIYDDLPASPPAMSLPTPDSLERPGDANLPFNALEPPELPAIEEAPGEGTQPPETTAP